MTPAIVREATWRQSKPFARAPSNPMCIDPQPKTWAQALFASLANRLASSNASEKTRFHTIDACQRELPRHAIIYLQLSRLPSKRLSAPVAQVFGARVEVKSDRFITLTRLVLSRRPSLITP
jgi:hypothetical protein